jgi:hypothetical protein
MSAVPEKSSVAALSATSTALFLSKGSMSKPPPSSPAVCSAASRRTSRTAAPAGPLTRMVSADEASVAGTEGTPSAVSPGAATPLMVVGSMSTEKEKVSFGPNPVKSICMTS